MKNATRLFSLALLTLCCRIAPAESIPNFFVAPISTELQRATLSSEADTYAIVNGDAFLIEGNVDQATSTADELLAALSNVQSIRQHLLLVCQYELSSDADRSRKKGISQKLKDLATSAGYKEVSVSSTSTSAKWDDGFRGIDELDPSADALEPLIEMEGVRVYPVRTRLSKMLHRDADCLVELVRPIDGRTRETFSELESLIRKAVEAAPLGEKRTIMFKLSSTSAGSEVVESLFNPRPRPSIPETDSPVLRALVEAKAAEYKPSPGLAMAQGLGFERIRYSLSQGGGAPETLVGQRVPDFELLRIDGETLRLHEFIQDKPALITFWGLACGPCRAEAPFLTTLHERFKSQFSIVAVNGYDDDREAVANYVEHDKLTHPIVLQGKAVSDDLFHVGAYPTTFWVNDDGLVVDYEVGFDSSERLEKRVKEMIEARK